MRKLSTGDDSTLGNFRDIAFMAFGNESAAVKYLDGLIATQGREAEVIQDETQVICMLAQLHDSPPGNIVVQKIF